MKNENILSKEELKSKLSEEEYHVTQEKGTERAYTGKYYKNKDTGVYNCICCDSPLFTSETKYESGSGWPSFYEPVSKDAVKEILDKTHGMVRTEVVCGTCEAHLGHVFNDGPKPTGMRYCLNSVSLNFEKKSGK